MRFSYFAENKGDERKPGKSLIELNIDTIPYCCLDRTSWKLTGNQVILRIKIVCKNVYWY